MKRMYIPDPISYKTMGTSDLRKHFLLEDLFKPGELEVIYTDVDRGIIGSAVPTDKELSLVGTKQETASEYFCERRELGVVNIGGTGSVVVDDTTYELVRKDMLYVGRGVKTIKFKSADAKNPAKFYLVSYPAHTPYPTRKVTRDEAYKAELGTQDEANVRVLRRYIAPQILPTCQIVMGMTELAPGSIWNTMPAHTHPRRSEVYMYFDLDAAQVVHLMGEPSETRHLIIRNEQAVISPSYSLHSAAGTKNYTFVWAMGGENQEFTDMDGIDPKDLK